MKSSSVKPFLKYFCRMVFIIVQVKIKENYILDRTTIFEIFFLFLFSILYLMLSFSFLFVFIGFFEFLIKLYCLAYVCLRFKLFLLWFNNNIFFELLEKYFHFFLLLFIDLSYASFYLLKIINSDKNLDL